MTPERIEEIKNVAGISDEWALEKIVNELLAALEESQQKVEVAKTTIESFGRITDDMEDEYKLLQIKYGEAQQTIARQREVLDFYANQEHWELPSFGRGQSKVTSDKGSKARELLKEGSDKA